MAYIAVRLKQWAVFLQFLVVMWEVDLAWRTFAESVRWSICVCVCVCVCVWEREREREREYWVTKGKTE